MEFGKSKNWYNLGPNALPLVGTWKMEKMTEVIIYFTLLAVWLSLTSIFSLRYDIMVSIFASAFVVIIFIAVFKAIY